METEESTIEESIRQASKDRKLNFVTFTMLNWWKEGAKARHIEAPPAHAVDRSINHPFIPLPTYLHQQLRLEALYH